MNAAREHWSTFGQQLGMETGIMRLMNDLGRAMAGQDRVRMLGGGNPALVPAVQAVWRRRMGEILADGDAYDRLLANYDTPKGEPRFIEAFAAFLNRQFNLGVRPENVAITNGGQFAFFCLLNLLAGRSAEGAPRRILFPMMPEYIGYAGQCLTADSYRSARPRIEFREAHRFKYRIDFDRLEVGDDIAAICLSRPTNPTGNVVTDDELARLHALAQAHGIPLLVDNAYGLPLPGIVFAEARLTWPKDSVLVFSLSKLGLPGTRTGLVVAPEPIIEALVAMNSVISLANGNVGQALVRPLLESDEMLQLSRTAIRPFYESKARQALAWVDEFFDDGLDYYVHRCEGALFLWFWFRGLPISDVELYERLKRRGVLVVPGSYFFFGAGNPGPQQRECIRVNYTQSESTVREGLGIIAEEVERAYHSSSFPGWSSQVAHV